MMDGSTRREIDRVVVKTLRGEMVPDTFGGVTALFSLT